MGSSALPASANCGRISSMHFKRPEYAALKIGVAMTMPAADSTRESASAIFGSAVLARRSASAGKSLIDRNFVSRPSLRNMPNTCCATSAVRDFDDGLPEIANTTCCTMKDAHRWPDHHLKHDIF